MRTLWLCGSWFLVLSTSGCEDQHGPSSSVKSSEVRQASSGDLSFAAQLGLAEGPVSESDARRIAELATGGTARSVEREDEDGEEVFEVSVAVEGATKEVEVRVSDGAVVEIEGEGSREKKPRP